MGNDFFIAAGLGFLLALDPSATFGLFSEARGIRSGALKRLVAQCLEMAVHCGAVLLLYVAGLNQWPLAAEVSWAPLFCFLLAYFFSFIRRCPDAFWIAVCAVSMIVLERGHPGQRLWLDAAKIIFGLNLFRFFLLGLRERLLLSRIPRAVSGLPVFLFSAAILSLALACLF